MCKREAINDRSVPKIMSRKNQRHKRFVQVIIYIDLFVKNAFGKSAKKNHIARMLMTFLKETFIKNGNFAFTCN